MSSHGTNSVRQNNLTNNALLSLGPRSFGLAWSDAHFAEFFSLVTRIDLCCIRAESWWGRAAARPSRPDGSWGLNGWFRTGLVSCEMVLER